MLRSGYFGHASRIHASRRYRTLGEIIEMHGGLHARVRTAFREWVHSGPHRSVMLMSQFRFAGARVLRVLGLRLMRLSKSWIGGVSARGWG